MSRDGGVGTLVIDYLMSVARNAEGLSAAASMVSSSILDLVAMSLGATSDAKVMGKGSARKALRHSVLKHVEAHVADPELSPGKVATQFSISPRYLHKVLEEGGRPFGRILLEQRLERCAKDLAAAKMPSISEVAFRWGLNDLSHFSQTFRERFGKPPRAFRQEQLHAS